MRNWDVAFLSGAMCGGCLLVAALTIVGAWVNPIGVYPDWRAFMVGAIIMPVMVVSVIALIVFVMWWFG